MISLSLSFITCELGITEVPACPAYTGCGNDDVRGNGQNPCLLADDHICASEVPMTF